MTQGRKKIVVTGSEGFVGRHVVRSLEKDFHVVGFDIARSIFHNTTRKEEVFAFMEVEKPDIVIHLAANPDVAKSLEFPQEDLYLNTLGTINMLEACRRFPVENFILASTAVVYGEMTGQAFKETDAPSPTTPYGIGKAAAEQYCNLYFKRYKIPTTVFRLFNIYGPGQTRNFAIPNMIARIREAGSEMQMFGSPNDTRDFVFIEDICRAFRFAIDKKPAGRTFNLCGGTEIPVLRVAEIIAKIMGKQTRFFYKDGADDNVRVSRILGDNTVTMRDLGWTPAVSLEAGLAQMINQAPVAAPSFKN